MKIANSYPENQLKLREETVDTDHIIEIPGLAEVNTQASVNADGDVYEYGDLIMDYLSAIGVDYVFGVPGGAIEPLYNAMARSERKEGPAPILARHEFGAAAMANGYARESGKLGVCCSTAGPGATNLLTGVACAYTDGVPLLAITAQTATKSYGLGSPQDSSCVGVDTVNMFASCTVYNAFVSNPEQLESMLLTAISCAFSSTPGPAHISIPLDILRQPAPKAKNTKQAKNLKPFIQNEVLPNNQTMETLKNIVEKVEKGVLLLGQDAEPAISEILTFAQEKEWDIVTTPMGKGLVSSFHPLNRGVFGIAGHEAAHEAIHNEDVEMIIAVGTDLDECSSGGWDPVLLSSKLVHIDANPRHLTRSPMSCLSVMGTPRLVFKELLPAKVTDVARHQEVAHVQGTFPSYLDDDAKAKCQEGDDSRVKPQALFYELSRKCPVDTRVTVDTGNSFLWGLHYWQTRKKVDFDKNLFHLSIGFGPMGWALGAAVGIAKANTTKPVVCFAGDGSILMNGQEVTTALQENLDIVFVILNDASLGTVKHGQRLAGAEKTSFELPQVNYAQFAEAMGLKATRVKNGKELAELDINSILAEGGPHVLEVLVDGDEIPPLGLRMKMLGTAKK